MTCTLSLPLRGARVEVHACVGDNARKARTNGGRGERHTLQYWEHCGPMRKDDVGKHVDQGLGPANKRKPLGTHGSSKPRPHKNTQEHTRTHTHTHTSHGDTQHQTPTATKQTLRRMFHHGPGAMRLLTLMQ